MSAKDRKIVEQTVICEMTRRPTVGSPAALNTITPCAACKLLRRRCAQECPFAPYFSPLEPQKFASVHKVFGASNVSKMLMEVPENQRADAANSLVYEANARLRDPVYGSTGTIYTLQHQAQVLRVELNAVRAEIMKYKCRDPMTQPPMLGVYNVNSDDCKVNNPTASTVNAADHTVKQRYYSIINHNR